MQYDLNNLSYENDQVNTVLKDNRFHEYPEPSLENDQKYFPYGENNQADVVAELIPPLRDDAELQSASKEGYVLEPANQPPSDTKIPEEGADYKPIADYQVPADTNQQEQFQQGTINTRVSSLDEITFA